MSLEIQNWPLKMYDITLSYGDFALKIKIHSQFLDIYCIFGRQTTFHLEDCPNLLSFCVNLA